jgi:hypothetical protein
MSLPKTQSDPNVEWHVLLRGERRGPYTPAGLRDLLETHPDGWSASVWRPGMLDWRPAREVESLQNDARGAQPVSPRKAEPISGRTDASGLPPVTVELTAELPASGHELSRSARPSSPSLRASRAEAAFILTPSESEVALRVAQTRTRAAPLFAATTHEMPSYSRPRRSPRTLYYLFAIGSLLLISVLLLLSKWRAAPMATPSAAAPPALAPHAVVPQLQEPAAAPPPPPVAVAIAPATHAAEAPAITPAAVLDAAPARVPAAAASQSERAEASVTRVRVRAHWAPVRAAADPSAKVLCSVPRGKVLEVSGQRPGTHARWFSVHCDAQTSGWVHENFLASVR